MSQENSCSCKRIIEARELSEEDKLVVSADPEHVRLSAPPSSLPPLPPSCGKSFLGSIGSYLTSRTQQS